MSLRIGTRGSELARWQANTVATLLRQRAGVECEIVIIKTTGDRMTEPDGIATRPSAVRSTSVVASKRSSTCAVPEFNAVWRRASSSVPEGTSTYPRGTAPRDDVRPSPVSRRPESLALARFPLGVSTEALDVVARDRRLSIRSRTSPNSVRVSVWSLRSLTFK